MYLYRDFYIYFIDLCYDFHENPDMIKLLVNLSECNKFLHNLVHQKLINFYNLHSSNKFDFYSACIKGYLNVIKYLVNLGVNIHFHKNQNNEFAFQLACQSGHLNVVKYLANLGVNIHACNEFAFGYTCEKGHLEDRKSTRLNSSH